MRHIDIRQWLRGACLALLLPTWAALGEEPTEYDLVYDARYGNWRAESSRSLEYDPAEGVYRMRAESRITLLGQTLTSITETASLRWRDDRPLPLRYRFDQDGIGARERSVRFDHEQERVYYDNDGKTGDYALTGPVYDELSAFLAVRKRLQRGEDDIAVDILDRDHVKEHRYRVVDTEPLHTALGDFRAVHVEQVREAGSERATDFWLAPDHDYVMLKMIQREPDGRVISLDVTQATLNGEALRAIEETHMGELAELEEPETR